MANPRILLELDTETGVVTVQGPFDRPDVMLKMLASAVSTVGGTVLPKDEDEEDGEEESRIITLNPPGGLHRA